MSPDIASTVRPFAEGTVTVGARFNGPPESGNGGYVCGLVGRRFDGPAEVTLRVPPPLERPLRVVHDGETIRLLDGDVVVAEGGPAEVEGVIPPVTVSLEDAEHAVDKYAGRVGHVFPTCFVCGPQREPGDGLCLFPGPVEGTEVVAAPWTPSADLADDGIVRPEIVWAALDCPGYFGGPVGKLAVLGRLAAKSHVPVLAGRPHVVVGWSIGSEGRRHLAATAVCDPGGGVLAVARSTWVELQRPPSPD